MRLFEILILITLLLSLINLFFLKKRSGLIHFQYGIMVLIVLCHILFEGTRWQMLPLYVFTAIIFIISIISAFRDYNKRIRKASWIKRILRFSGIFVTFLLLIYVSIPPILIPVFKLPKPSGSFAVGTTTLFFTDTARLDTYSPETNKYRELSVRIWYPASTHKNEKRLPYMQADEARYMSNHLKFPPYFLNHFKRVKTDSYYDSTPQEGQYPIILYSPSGSMVENTGLFQELASNGYIVFCVGHPYWNAFYYDAHGQPIPFNGDNKYYKAIWDEENSSVVTDIKWELTSAQSPDIKREAQNKLNISMPLEVADIRKWSEDLSFLLDEFNLRKEARERIFKNLNTESVGVIGFSKGGAAAGQFCVSDERCTAGINLSGFMFGDAVNNNFKRPFMIMESVEEDCPQCTPISQVLYENAESDAYMVSINGANHGNFTDFSLVFNDFIGLKGSSIGPINGHRFLQIQNHYVLSFFDQYLKGVSSDLLNGSAREYPEVIFSTNKIRIPQ